MLPRIPEEAEFKGRGKGKASTSRTSTPVSIDQVQIDHARLAEAEAAIRNFTPIPLFSRRCCPCYRCIAAKLIQQNWRSWKRSTSFRFCGIPISRRTARTPDPHGFLPADVRFIDVRDTVVGYVPHFSFRATWLTSARSLLGQVGSGPLHA